MNIIRETGWSYDYVLHGISWINLRMMIADAPQSVSNKDVVTEASDDDLDNFINQ